MKIVVTGGGSGGHITPILAVAHELKKLHPEAYISFVIQKGDPLVDVPARDPNIDEVHAVSAGKFRRYHGEGLKQLLDVKTFLLNVRDAFRVLAGIYQSRRLLKQLQPDIIFIKGGFVGVPVGLAAAMLHKPFITHDSDSVPGLANRIIARWAQLHAVGMPKELYAYDQAKTVTVGVPVTAQYEFVTPVLQAQYRAELHIPEDAKMLFIIGGGQGARRINDAMVQILPALFKQSPNLWVVHGAGRANEAAVQAAYKAVLPANELARVQVAGFIHEAYRYSGAADVIITRAGATNLAEFAIQGKACIVVPAPFLTGGHQLKNAAYLHQKQAIEQITETDVADKPEDLAVMITDLLEHSDRRLTLGKAFTAFGHPQSAQELAQLIIKELHGDN